MTKPASQLSTFLPFWRRTDARTTVSLGAAALLIAVAVGCRGLPARPEGESGTPGRVETPPTTSVPPSPTAAGTPPTSREAIRRFAPGESVWITSIRMQDPTAGWAIAGESQWGDHVMRTGDGGQTWQDVTPPEPAPTEAEGSKVAT